VVRYFEDVEVGEEFATPGRTITEAYLLAFAAVSGDHAALDHTGNEPGLPPIIPELLVVTLTSGLGFRVPRPSPQVLAFMVLDWRYLEPVRVGDTIHSRVRITAKRAMKDGGILVERRETVNQRGEVVQECEYKLMVARRPRG
jgi:acyl dehydratase